MMVDLGWRMRFMVVMVNLVMFMRRGFRMVMN